MALSWKTWISCKAIHIYNILSGKMWNVRFKGKFQTEIIEICIERVGGGGRESESEANQFNLHAKRENPFQHASIMRFAYINKLYQKHIHSARTFMKRKPVGCTHTDTQTHKSNKTIFHLTCAQVAAGRRVLPAKEGAWPEYISFGGYSICFFHLNNFQKLVYNSILQNKTK